MKRWQCRYCAFIYDEAVGIPEEGIPPGTPLQDLPDDWMCPECGTTKDDFDEID